MRIRHKKYLLLLLLLMTGFFPSQAQDDAQLSQYWAMPAYYNAGAIGLTDKLNLRAATRQQWVGMPGAPKTFFGMVDMPVRFLKANHGVGVILSTDKYGLFNTTMFGLQYAYKVKLWGGQLSLGLQLGLVSQSFDGTEVYIPESDYHDQNDEAIPTTELQGMAFDVGFGIFYTHKYFYAGLSSTHLTQPTISFDENYEGSITRAYYFMAGGNIPLRNALYELQPSMLLKTTFQMTQAEVTLRLMYNKFLWGGLAYRWKEAVIFMAGCQFKGFMLGYSYDYSTSAIQKVSSGSHEIFAGYSIKLNMEKGKKNKHKSIRIL
ncbi:MAG: type IX secretion system membrane protein PorP/SprF [Porphyromonadaceae bacterium]|nr:type IX secretion system membrane protein PorP/SprF [Porphyromonadaceae bacterium]